MISKKLLNTLSFFVTFYFLLSCSSGRITKYDTEYPLSNKIAESRTTDLNVNIPEGWFEAVDNEGYNIDLWLVRDDYSATINLTSIHLDDETKNKIGSDELRSVLEYSKTFKKAKHGKHFTQLNDNVFFDINKIPCGSYEYETNEGLIRRVIVFKYNGIFFELLAAPSVDRIAEVDIDELFSVQQAVISSIK